MKSRKVKLMRKEVKRYGFPETFAHETVVVLSSFMDRNGNVFRPLAYQEEDKIMPAIVNLNPSDPGFRIAVTNFYKNLRKKVEFQGAELEIGLDNNEMPLNTEEYLLYKMATAHPYTGKTKEDCHNNRMLQFYIVDPEAEDEVKSTELESETKAMVEFAKLVEDDNKLDLVLRNVIIKYPETGSLTELLALPSKKKQLKISELLKKDAMYFLEIVSDKDLQYKAEIMSMVEGGILVKEGNRFLNGSSNLGSLDGTIAWMKDPNNSSEYVVLQARLQEFGIPLKEYKTKAKK
jgi:hypothetical protein